MDYFSQFGSLALGARLRRLGEKVGQDISSIYKDVDSGFEPRWFPFFQLLSTDSPLTVTEIAERLSITHPSVIQIMDELKDKGLVSSTPDKVDKRRTLLSLTPKARALHNMMNNIWRDLKQVTDDLIKSCENNVLELLTELEQELNKQSLDKRFQSLRKKNQHLSVKIKEYSPKLKKHFIRLNEEWISKYFSLEEPDRKALANPEKYILNKGGFIFFAQVGDEIAGTCALLKRDRNVYELSKMRVLEKFQGKKIGYKLIDACKSKALENGGKRLVLETNSCLKSAIKLYSNAGFVQVVADNEEPSEYSPGRADFAMRLDLHRNN
jgi:DNA-binding MarR family transcriptional regulator/GNAT superfamily N-acetyltransferase